MNWLSAWWHRLRLHTVITAYVLDGPHADDYTVRHSCLTCLQRRLNPPKATR